jgi:hypothetical protein
VVQDGQPGALGAAATGRSGSGTARCWERSASIASTDVYESFEDLKDVVHGPDGRSMTEAGLP